MNTLENSSNEESIAVHSASAASHADPSSVAPGTTVIPNPVISGPSPTPVTPAPIVAPGAPPAAPGGHGGDAMLDDGVTQQILGSVVATNQALSPYVELVDPLEKKRMTKPRLGIEQQIPLLIRLSEEKGVALDDYSFDQLSGDVASAERLASLLEPVSNIDLLLVDTLFSTKSRYTSGASTLYQTLSTLATRDLALANALEPVRKVFARKTTAKSKKAATSKAGSTAVSAPAGAGATSGSLPSTERRRKPREVNEMRRDHARA